MPCLVGTESGIVHSPLVSSQWSLKTHISWPGVRISLHTWTAPYQGGYFMYTVRASVMAWRNSKQVTKKLQPSLFLLCLEVFSNFSTSWFLFLLLLNPLGDISLFGRGRGRHWCKLLKVTPTLLWPTSPYNQESDVSPWRLGFLTRIVNA